MPPIITHYIWNFGFYFNMKKISLILTITCITLFSYNVYSDTPAPAASKGASNIVSADKKELKYEKGAQVYNNLCIKCHQENGMGIPGVFPPLKGSDFLKKAAKKRLLDQALHGSSETLTVNGVQYSTPMPPQVNSVDDAIEVVNYVLNAWGNNYGVATAADAKDLKK